MKHQAPNTARSARKVPKGSADLDTTLMDSARQNAYRALLCAAMLHVKWDLASLPKSSFWMGSGHCRSAQIAAARSRAFHNLAILLDSDFEVFDEEQFWTDIEHFRQQCPGAMNTDYRWLYEQKLANPDFPIIRPLPVEDRGR
jgi:hypothetical protein